MIMLLMTKRGEGRGFYFCLSHPDVFIADAGIHELCIQRPPPPLLLLFFSAFCTLVLTRFVYWVRIHHVLL